MTHDPRQASDEGLAREAQAGSRACFEVLVTRYERRVFQFLLARLGHRHDAEDIAQDTFVRAYQRLVQFDSGRRFAPWLFGIARNLATSHWRKQRETPGEIPDLEARGPSPSGTLESREMLHNVWHTARTCLSEKQFSALWLRYSEAMTIKETAAMLKLTDTHVKVLLHRGRLRLARALRETMPDPMSSLASPTYRKDTA